MGAYLVRCQLANPPSYRAVTYRSIEMEAATEPQRHRVRPVA